MSGLSWPLMDTVVWVMRPAGMTWVAAADVVMMVRSVLGGFSFAPGWRGAFGDRRGGVVNPGRARRWCGGGFSAPASPARSAKGRAGVGPRNAAGAARAWRESAGGRREQRTGAPRWAWVDDTGDPDGHTE